MKKNKDSKISVILPYKNAQKTLRGCLDSLIFQTYENLEIICINCGAADNSSKIVQNYRERDNRIRTIDSYDTTPGSAKNLGIAAASGKYISFVYPQDRLLLNLYEAFYETVLKEVDLYIFNAEIKNDEQMNIYKKRFFTSKLWNNHNDKNHFHTIYDCKNPFFGLLSSVNKIYNLHFLKKQNIKFAPDLIFEDYLFHVESLINAKSICVNADILYKFKETDKERIRKSENVTDIFEILNRIETSLKETGLYERFKYALLEYKYMQSDYIFKNLKFSQRAKFFNHMQKYLKQIKMNDFDKKICEQLSEYARFESIMNLDWAHYSLGKRFL